MFCVLYVKIQIVSNRSQNNNSLFESWKLFQLVLSILVGLCFFHPPLFLVSSHKQANLAIHRIFICVSKKSSHLCGERERSVAFVAVIIVSEFGCAPAKVKKNQRSYKTEMHAVLVLVRTGSSYKRNEHAGLTLEFS